MCVLGVALLTHSALETQHLMQLASATLLNAIMLLLRLLQATTIRHQPF